MKELNFFVSRLTHLLLFQMIAFLQFQIVQLPQLMHSRAQIKFSFQAFRELLEIITQPGLINLDFADVKTVMTDAGSALMGIGSARGENRATRAAELAISSPLLEASIDGAMGVLLSVAGGSDLGLFEINEACELVQAAAHPDARIIFGTTIDDALGDEVRITVIAAGFAGGEPKKVEMPVINASTLGGVADPIPSNDPLSVALDLDSSAPRKRITFEELISEDEIDVPDFMK